MLTLPDHLSSPLFISGVGTAYLPDHLSSPLFISGVQVAQSLVFSLMFVNHCLPFRPIFVLFWSLHCLSFVLASDYLFGIFKLLL